MSHSLSTKGSCLAWFLSVQSCEWTCWHRLVTSCHRVSIISRWCDIITVLPAAGTVEGGLPGASAATGSSPCAGHGWHRSPPCGSSCRSSGLSSYCSRGSWSHRRSPSSQNKKLQSEYETDPVVWQTSPRSNSNSQTHTVSLAEKTSEFLSNLWSHTADRNFPSDSSRATTLPSNPGVPKLFQHETEKRNLRKPVVQDQKFG